MEEQHVPVFPNINQSNQKKQKKNIFEDNQDPDTQRILKKKVDVLEMDSQKTNEESINKGGTTSWLIIALVVVIIILLIGITYYVVKNTNKKEPIPPNIIRPNYMGNPQQGHHGPFVPNFYAQGQPQGQPTAQNSPNTQQKPNEEAEYNELKEVLKKTQTNQQGLQQEQVNQQILQQGQKQSEGQRQNKGHHEEQSQNEEQYEHKEDIFTDKNIENLILDEESDDTFGIKYTSVNEIEEFQRKVIEDSME